jgi:hypothetical protein
MVVESELDVEHLNFKVLFVLLSDLVFKVILSIVPLPLVLFMLLLFTIVLGQDESNLFDQILLQVESLRHSISNI